MLINIFICKMNTNKSKKYNSNKKSKHTKRVTIKHTKTHEKSNLDLRLNMVKYG